MRHRTVRIRTALEPVTLDDALESPALRLSRDIDPVVRLEHRRQHAVSGFNFCIAADREFPDESSRLNARLLEMTETRLRDAAFFGEIHQTQLDRIVAVLLDGLALDDDAGPRLNNSYRDHAALTVEDLRHPDLFP